MAIADLLLRLLATAVATCGVWVAFQGLQTWRRQLYGQASFDVARRLAMSAYTVRNQIQQCRWGMAADSKEVLLNNLRKAVADMETHALEAQILWGQPVRDANERLMECAWQYFAAVWQYTPGTDPAVRQLKDEEYKKLYMTVYGNDDSEFGRQVTQAVQSIEDVLRPHLFRRTTK